MKKLTFMLIAALMAVVSYAQTPWQKGQLSLADRANAEQRIYPVNGKIGKTASMKARAKAPAKIIKVDIDALAGERVICSYAYDYSQTAGLYPATPATEANVITVTKIDDNTIGLEGLVYGQTTVVKATVDKVNGTFAIADGDTLYMHSSYGPIVMANASGDGDITGTIDASNVIIFDGLWCLMIGGDGQYAGYRYGNYCESSILPINGSMTYADKNYAVAIEQDADTKEVLVWNFDGEGVAVAASLKDDRSFEIPEQVLFYYNSTYGLFSTEGTIVGKGTDTQLVFNGTWRVASDLGYIYGGVREAATIALTDGSTFDYPVIEEVAAVPATPSVTDFWHYNAELGYAQVYVNIPTQDVDGNAIKSALITYQLYAEVNGEQIAVGEPIAYTDETVAVDGANRIVKISDIAVKTYTRMGVKSIYTAAGETNESAIGWLTIPSYIGTAPEGLTLVELPVVGTRTLSNNAAAYNGTVKLGRSGSDVYIQGLFSLVPEGWVKGTIADGKLTIPAGQYVGIRESNGSRIYTLAYTSGVGIGDITFTEKGYNWYVSDQMILETPDPSNEGGSFQAYYASGLTIGTEPPVASGTYYLYNKEAEKFMAAGDAWGTRAILNTAGIDFGVALAEGKYTFDSNIANSAANHFLNGEFTDGVAFAWTVEKVGDYCTISNGTQFLAAGENDLVMLVDEATDAAMWKFCTLADRLVALEAATAEAGVDATFLIPGANFGRNDKRVDSSWNVSADCTNKNLHGGDNTNMCAESWHSTFTISQVLANAPAGKYLLTAQGFYRQDGEADPAPVFFANDKTVDLPLLTGTENSMADASASFTNGLYTIDPIEVTVAATGALSVGVKGTSVTQWVIWDNFRLTYLGNQIDLSELIAAYQNALAAAQNALNDEANAVVTGEERTTLSDVVTANTGVDETSADALTAAIEALTDATNAFNVAKGDYQALADAKTYVATLSFEYAAADKKAAAEEAAAAVAATAAEAVAKKAALFTAYRQYAESSALLEGEEGAVNMTDLIVNPAAEEAVAEPWTLVKGEGSEGSIGTLDNEPWTDGNDNSTHKYFDGGNWGANAWDVALQQNITLPAGKYQLTVKSRASAELSSFNLFAGEDKVEMTKIGASNGLFNRGWNDNSVVFELAEEATIAIGVQGVTSTVNNWMSFSDFRLVQFLGNQIDLSELIAAYQNALAAAQNALNDEANAVVTGEERTTLSDVVTANTGVDETSADALTAAIEALTDATNAFNVAKGDYQALADAKTYVATLSFEYAAADKKAAAEEAAAAVAATAAEAVAKKAALFTAYRQYAESSALLEGEEGAVNMTDLIVNPAAEEAVAEPWTLVKGEGSEGSIGTLDNEPWTDGNDNSTHKYFDGGNWGANAWDVALQQNITLPAGKYQLTVKSRASAELSSFNLFAGEDKVEMTKIGASNGLFNRGWNDNSVVFELAEEATIAIGVQGVTSTVNNWMSFSDFRLVQFPAVEELQLAENVSYYWESPNGTPKEYGGVISYENGDGNRLNYSNSGYYTICLNGKKANMDDETPSANAGYMLLTLNEAVAEGDTIAITGYITKDKSSKSSAYLVFETGATAESAVFGDESNIHENLGGEINTKNVFVTGEAAGSKTIKITRGQTGTNLFITKLVIAKAKGLTVGITNVNVNDFQNGAIYNLRGQRVEKATKGLYIINGKKVFLK